jgi:DNA modification methylase
VTVQEVGDSALSEDEDGALLVSIGENVFRITGDSLEVEMVKASVFYEEKPAASRLHPTMKPVALYSRQIEYSSAAGGLVLDIFGGSGTTIIACEKLRRRARVMEYDPHYCDVIIKRWEDFTGRKAEIIDA